jgi:hypothetical protein
MIFKFMDQRPSERVQIPVNSKIKNLPRNTQPWTLQRAAWTPQGVSSAAINSIKIN